MISIDRRKTNSTMKDLLGLVILTLFTFLCQFNSICAYEVTPFTDQPFASLSYIAVVRGKAALPCHVTTSTPDDSVALILWYKDDALAPLYTLDARKGTLEQARTLTAPVLQGRAYFNLHNRPAFLKIDPVDLSDAGDYRCRVDFKKARTINTVINLKVIVPPDEPSISTLGEVNLKGLIGPYNEGDALKLICTTNGGKPRPTLTWWRDNTLIDDTFEYVDKEVTTNQLTIPSLARHHLLSKLTCQAVNNNMTVPLATSITLELNLKPTEVHITQLSPVLNADKEVTFECRAIGSRPKPSMHWLFDGKKYSTGITGDQSVTSRITLKVTKSQNGAMLTCIAENPQIMHSQVSDQLQLDIQYKPEVKLEFGFSTVSVQSIQEGNDVYFDCKIDSNPKPIKPIQWKFNGNQLSPRQGVIQSNQSLVLQKVSRHQSGLYQCQVTNSQGTGISNEINLEIRFAPVCQINAILTYGLALHESVVLRCYTLANPDKVSFQWRFQDKTDQITSPVQSKGKFSDLIYTVHSPEDYGVVHCIAKNDVGLQRSSCKFFIKPGEPPDFPYNCKIVNQSDDSLVIFCVYKGQVNLTNENRLSINDALSSSTSSSSSPSPSTSSSSKILSPSSINPKQPQLIVHPKTSYIAEVYSKSDLNLLLNVTSSSPFFNESSSSSADLGETADPLRIYQSFSSDIEFFITDLSPSTVYRIALYAANPIGRSAHVTWLEGSTLRSAEKLVDSSSAISGSEYSGDSVRQKSPSISASGVISEENGAALLRGVSLLIVVLIGGGAVIVGTVALGIIAIFRLRRNILSSDESSTVLSASSSLPCQRRKSSGNSSHHEVPTLSQQQSTKGTLIRDDDTDDCCCGDNSVSDQLLLTGNGNHLDHHHHHHSSAQYHQQHQQHHHEQFNASHQQESRNDRDGLCRGQQEGHHNSNSEKGPPDIIPSFGYSLPNPEKQYLSYEYSNEPSNSPSANIVHYAELAFPGESGKILQGQSIYPLPGNDSTGNEGGLTGSRITGGSQKRIEYAKIEFQKTTRVNIIGTGSPKFESTV